ncbi:UNVERIFIED_CONTAM: hypothetical protein Sindi_2149000 [Sesamum indicum]
MPCGIKAGCRHIMWASDLRCGPTRARHKRRPRRRRAPRCPECALDMRRALRAHAERRNAEAERGCSLPSRDESAGSEIVGETHGGRLASRGRPLRDANACVPRASTNMGILDRRAPGHAVPRREAFRCRASELQC